MDGKVNNSSTDSTHHFPSHSMENSETEQSVNLEETKDNLSCPQSTKPALLPSEESTHKLYPVNSYILTRTYSQFCSCEPQNACPCASSHHHSLWSKLLPRNASYWPALKLSVLVILGSIPWIFILIYILLTYL